MQITLFTFPVTCAKVAMILLEETGAPFDTRLVRLMRGEHKQPDFMALNPKGKVPALVIDGEALTENVAIAIHLDTLFPQAHLLPRADALGRARQIADLCFCSATLHQLVTRICVPAVSVDAHGIDSVRTKAMAAICEFLQIIEDRLADAPWWYGEAWSAMDAYIYWVFTRIGAGSTFDTSAFPRLLDHAARMEQRPAVQRALAREAADCATLDAEGGMPRPA